MNRSIVTALCMFCSFSVLGAQVKPATPPAGKKDARDSAFTAMQERGKKAMGVDQYTSTHHFDALRDGGRIMLVRDVNDSAGIAQIRTHIREIAAAFKAGDFSTPEFVHMQRVPGTAVMAAKSKVITYEPHDVPRGAELRIRTKDPDALRAIHEFIAFQRMDHRAMGMVDTGVVRR